MIIIDHVTDIMLARAAGTTRTPDEAIAVLAVLPHRGSMLAAVLVRISQISSCPCHQARLRTRAAAILPVVILFDGLAKVLESAGALGDLPTIELLVGPTTIGRLAWFETSGIVSGAIENNCVAVLEWILNAVSILEVLLPIIPRSWPYWG
ncbi:hypothetical protein BC828DRAFT_378150 [Blastocladiella britannica]|nr:hypothetical protein BC828DRAFT_378150 [Blastocladiella britannica]